MQSIFKGRLPGRYSGTQAGFSLIEMVMVVAILLALTFFAMPTLEIVYVKAREKQLHERLFEMRRAIDAYVAARNASGTPYPPTIASLTETMPITHLRAGTGVNAGPYLAKESLGNPFIDTGDVFLWDIRRDDGEWLPKVSDPATLTRAFDVRYPKGGLGRNAIDDTSYSDW